MKDERPDRARSVPEIAPATDADLVAGLTPGALTVLLQATRILASSLDLETTLASVARLSLPHLGSWCIVDLCDGVSMRRLAIIHPDPAQQWLADRLLPAWPPHRNDPLGAPSAVRTGRSEVVFPITDQMLTEAAGSVENLELLRALQIGGVMTIPMIARGSVLGAITYVCPNHGDFFSQRDLVLAEDLAARCAIAIDNARLFKVALDARREAEQANLAKMRFLSTMSHELRTPLNAIAGYAELLSEGLRGPLSPLQLRDLARIKANEVQLLGLVEAVLEYARIDAGKIQFDARKIPLATALADAEDSVALLAKAKGIRLEGLRYGRHGNGVSVFADPPKLHQVLANLLSNAIKFSRSGTRILVEQELLGERVEIHIRDEGVGIAADDMETIFEPFVQAKSGGPKSGGIGLGLAISRELLDGMGGTLRARSVLGEGSTFTISLPLRRPSSGRKPRGELRGQPRVQDAYN